MAELQFNTKIKSLQTNWGVEFRPLAPFLACCGIQQRLGLTLLHHASLPLKFWNFAF